MITGFLGVGKTTAIKSLLARKPAAEKWAVLVNEFGEIGIDEAAISEESDAIRMVPGGCICCVGNVAMGVALIDIIRKLSPDRILIEPTGLGHPAGILDLLREAEGAGQIDLRATVCLVDPRRIDELNDAESDVFQDQIHMADGLVAHKCDLASDAELAAFQHWAKALFPPKSYIGQAQKGTLDVALLDLEADPLRTPLFPDAHTDQPADTHADTHHHAHHGSKQNEIGVLAPGHPVRAMNVGQGHSACGWVFSPADVFDRRRLLDFLSAWQPVTRLKGVFRTGRHWMLVDRVGDELGRSTIAYRRDSRVEVIVADNSAAAAPDWDGFEAALLECLRLHAMTTP